MSELKVPEMMLGDLGPDDVAKCIWPRREQPRNELPSRCWHIAHSANPSDGAVEMALKNAGYSFYYPKTIEMRPIPKRRLPPKQRNSPIPIMRRTELPLFARYFFIDFDWRDGRWHELFELMGIQGVLCGEDGGKLLPCPISDAVVKALQAKEENGLIPGSVTVRELAYEIGEKVRIANGPFVTHSGDVLEIPEKPLEQLDGSERLTLLVSLFGRKTPIELTIADIEKL